MFDVMVAAAPLNSFSGRVVLAFRAAGLRVIVCDLAAGERPSSSVRVDVAIACAERLEDVGRLATRLREALAGPPPVLGLAVGGGTPPAGTIDCLPHDVPTELLVARVQRAAVRHARRASRLLLSGELDDVGLHALLDSLRARQKNCIVKVSSGAREAEWVIDRGEVVRARADGVSGDRPEAVLEAVATWAEARFEVFTSADDLAGTSRSAPGPARVDAEASRVHRPARSALSGDSEVALAAAVLNAVAAHARVFLSSEDVAQRLESARLAVRHHDAGIDAFAVSKDGLVSVSRVTHARTALPQAVAAWCRVFFDGSVRARPNGSQADSLTEVLGGLGRMLEKVEWGAALLATGRGPERPEAGVREGEVDHERR